MVFGAIVSFAVGVWAGVHIVERYEIPTRRERKEMCNEMRALWRERVPSKDERREIFDDIRALWMERMEERMAMRLEAQLDLEDGHGGSHGHGGQPGAAPGPDAVGGTPPAATVGAPSEPKTYRQILQKYRKKRLEEMNY